MSDLKPIPVFITKSKLQHLYRSIYYKEVIESINEIKRELRGCRFNSKERIVRPDEFRVFVLEYGNPPGYQELIPELQRIAERLQRRELGVKEAQISDLK